MKILHFIFSFFILVVFLHFILPVVSTNQFQGRAFRIKPRPCTDRQGQRGICMFQWECRQHKGVMLTTCFDRFLFGTCCQLSKEEMEQLQVDAEPEVHDTNKLKPAAETAIKVPQPPKPTSTTPLVHLSNSAIAGSSSVNNTNNFELSEEDFSPPEPLANHLIQVNTPSYSTPDIDKILQQFLGNVLGNHSQSEMFLTEPTLFEGSGVTSTATIPSSTVPLTWQLLDNVSFTDGVTTPVDIYTENASTLSSTPATTMPLIVETVSENGDYELEYPLEEPEANVSTVVYEPISNKPLSLDGSVTPILLGNTTISSITVVENQTSIENHNSPDHHQNWEVLEETNETLEPDVTDFYDHEYFEEETTTSAPPPTPTSTTTTTTTTTTTEPPTTTLKPYNYKKDDVDMDDAEKFFFSSWSWPSTLLIHIFTAIPALVQKLLGKRLGLICRASACEPEPKPADQPSLLPNEAYCGVRPLVPNGRIVGGTSSKFGEWPWQVLIKEATWLGLFVKNKCGGVLLNQRYVITAAHCQPSFLASLLVVFGESDLSISDEEQKSIQRNVKRVIVHRKFNVLTFDNDLALLELERPIEYKPHIVPVCLPPDDFQFMDKIAVVSGWGRLKYGGRLPTHLQQVDIPIIPNKKCQQMFLAAGHIKSINDKFLCAGYQEGEKDSCEGDSGGPLVVQGDDGRWILVGTVSHGIKCAYPNLPGVYIRISAYKSWILKVIGS